MRIIFFLVLAYLLGSLPFGYFFTKIFSRKNILEIGWKKTSGSNVFKHVGTIPGIFTAIFDISKGFLAVFLAKKFHLNQEVQCLAGVLTIIGHNWSIFLKLAGGRGIGTFVGAFFALHWQKALLYLIPSLFATIFFETSLVTIIFLFGSFLLMIKSGEKTIAFFFIFLSFFPIFLKRLSPLKEISLKKRKLFFNRLIFDDDFSHPIIKRRLTKR